MTSYPTKQGMFNSKTHIHDRRMHTPHYKNIQTHTQRGAVSMVKNYFNSSPSNSNVAYFLHNAP